MKFKIKYINIIGSWEMYTRNCVFIRQLCWPLIAIKMMEMYLFSNNSIIKLSRKMLYFIIFNFSDVLHCLKKISEIISPEVLRLLLPVVDGWIRHWS